MAASGETVLVTGANGFIALHILGKLLERGYKVIGTVRSQEKVDSLYKKFGTDSSDSNLKLIVVEDITVAGAFDSIFQKEKEIKYVLHTASPFKYGFTDDYDEGYRKPAVEGTVNVLASVKKYGEQVVTVVVTSSFAAIRHLDKISDPTYIHNENTWNPDEWEDVKTEYLAYATSKKLAEKAAWDFVKENDVKFNLDTITPPFVFGPQFFEEDAANDKLNTSNEVIVSLLKTDPNDTKFYDGHPLAAVDVRDVAEFHILAFERGIKNQRLFPSGEALNDQKILNIINEYIPQLSGKVAKGQPSKAYTAPTVGFSSEKSKQLLGGYEFIPLKDQVVDTVKQILKAKGGSI